jgi:PAS domain S-box-containing protein
VAESLIQVAAELHSLHDMDAVLERIMHYTMRVIPTFRTASIMLVENEEILRVHRFNTGGSNTQVPVKNVTIRTRDIPNLKHIVSTGQPIVIDDTHRSESWISRDEGDWTRSYVGVPIRASSDVVGMINLRSDMPGAFTAAHASQLQAFADHAGVVIHNIRLYDAVLQSIGELTALYRATSLLFTADNLTELGAQVAQAVVDEFQQVDCGVILIDPDDPAGKRLIRLERRGEMRRRVQRDLTRDGSGMVPAAIRTGETLYAPDVVTNPNYLESDPSTRAELVVPLPTSQGVIGVLDLQSSAVDAFSERDRRVIKAFAERAAAALDKMFLVEEIRQHAADLEERVNARARELRATTERIEGIFNSTSDAIVVSDVDGVIRQTNVAFTRMFGYSPEEITGRPLTLLVMPVDRPLLNIQPSDLQSLRTRTHPQRIELAARRRDGATFVADVAVSSVVREERSELIYSIRDITDRKEAETGLRRTRDQLQAILDNTTVSIYVKDSHSRYILANRQCEQLAARAGKRFLGNTDLDVFTEDVAVTVRANDKIVLDSGQSHHFEEAIQYADEDTPHVFLSMKVPLVDEMGRAYAVCGISTDITAQKHLEQELRETLRVERELGELKSRFVSMVSHEFRTPLTTILSSSELLRLFSERMDDDRKLNHLKKIQSQVHHLTDMLDSILTLNRGEVVGLRFDPTEIDINDFCAMTIEEVMLSARPGQHIVADHQPPGMQILIDERLLRIVLTNLLTNAFKYSPENSAISLSIRIEPGLLIIRVADEGIGIPEDDLKHLFTAFHRATNVGVTPGTGLGLSILKQNIDAYGGTIHVASTLGEGTTFTVNLPLNDPNTSGV